MAAVRSEVRGVVVSVQERTYDAFTNSEGQAVPGGVRYVLWVLEEYGSSPTLIRVSGTRRQLIEEFIGNPKFFGAAVVAQCYVGATGSGRQARLELSLDSIDLAPKSVRAAS